MIHNRYGFAKRMVRRLGDAIPLIRNLRLHSRKKKNAHALERYREANAALLAQWQEDAPPLFDSIEIETINRCNGTCGFCPVNKNLDPRPATRMAESLFRKIVDELSVLEYSHAVSLFSNNEPFLDVRMEQFVDFARKKLPKARLLLSTNGTLLTPEKYVACIDKIDWFVVNNYCSDFTFSGPVRKIIETAKSRPEWWCKTDIHMRYNNDLLMSRGGDAPNYHDSPPDPLDLGCQLPAKQLIVRPDGKVSLCCSDALGKITLGDLTTESIGESWNKPENVKLRREILENRQCLERCKYCDNLLP